MNEAVSQTKEDRLWQSIEMPVFNYIRVHLIKRYSSSVLKHFNSKIEYVVRRYTRYLPSHVALNEVDDLKTLAQLEFFETVKVWDPKKNSDIWPLANMRILGALKDHIRYLTKSDPSRFYEWISDAAFMLLTINKRADFSVRIERGEQLKQAMEALTLREKQIVNLYVKEDRTFQDIGLKLDISESQVSRIYKKSIEKMKKELSKE